MTRKVTVALFDKDLRATMKEYPLNSDGTRIEIRKGGKRHFMPEIDNHTFLELPYRGLLTPWKLSYKRVYFAMRWSKACVNFYTGQVPGPDPQTVMEAAGTDLIKNLGKEQGETSVIQYCILGLLILILLKVLGVIV